MSTKFNIASTMLRDRVGFRREATYRVGAAYKRKADKVQPVDTCISDGSIPGGSKSWREEVMKEERYQQTKYPEWLTPKFSTIPRGQRLTLERISKIIVGDLSPEEKDIFMEMLYN